MGQAVGVAPCALSCNNVTTSEFDIDSPRDQSSSSSQSNTRSTFRGSSVNGIVSTSEVLCDRAGEATLPAHERPRKKGPGTMRLISEALHRSRLCARLDNTEIEALVTSMQYHVFDMGDHVIKEGGIGSHFFVAHTDGLEVTLQGGPISLLPRGRAFGELALLQKFPRPVGVVAKRSDVGVWAADGEQVRQVVQASALRQLSEVRFFLESVRLFEGFTTRQLDCIVDAGTLVVCQAGERFVQGKSDVSSAYLVKAGELCLARPRGADKTSGNQSPLPVLLRPGGCIGERALLYGEPSNVAVEAVRRCELLRLDMSRLRQLLGGSLCPLRLQQGLIISVMQRSGHLGTWTRSQRRAAAQAMTLSEYPPGSVVDCLEGFLVVIDGSLRLSSEGSEEKVLHRGHWHETVRMPLGGSKDTFAPISPKVSTPPTSPFNGVRNLAAVGSEYVRHAGPEGCRIAVLTYENASAVLDAQSSGRSSASWGNGRLDPDGDEASIVRLMSKVCIFQHMPRCHIHSLARGAKLRTFQHGDRVVTQGEDGSSFFIIARGEACAIVNGRAVRRLAQHAYFGDQALLFGEPHSATVQVVSNELKVCVVDSAGFARMLREQKQTSDQLIERARMRDPTIALKDLEKSGVIGTGTSGVVYLVRHRRTGSRYALKRVAKPDEGKVPHEVLREVLLLSEVDHPFVSFFSKTFETSKSVYMLLEYAPGGELHAAIRTISTVLSRRQAMFYVGSLLLVLENLAGRSIVYRDLKPENVMLDSKGYLKLIDFGSAKKLQPGQSKTFTRVGTPHYMAPEVMRAKGYGPAVDLWALGIILYELVCGYLPFGDALESTVDVCKAVLEGSLEFPEDLDKASRDLARGLLVPRPPQRLGCGSGGYLEVKDAAFFGLDGLGVDARTSEFHRLPGHPEYFSLLLNRELKAPIAPSISELLERGQNPSVAGGSTMGNTAEESDNEEEQDGTLRALLDEATLFPAVGSPKKE
mmetsp:Transcript_108166/g.304670  ORF Transcript_108166/g.304670 Transcript_108166/m.304670 type:complete len:980 (+) Transcript_108166:79-3018(+)